MFFSLVISSEVLKDVVQAEFVTSEECKICLIRTMQFQAKNMIMGNALTLDLEFLFLKEFWYFCLKNSPVFSLELLMTLIDLSLIVPALRTHLLLALIVAAGASSGSNCHWELLA